MLNKMNKMEIAGLTVAGLGTIAGIGIAVYTKIKTGKEAKEIENIMETVSDCAEEIDELILKATQAVTEDNEKEFLEIMKKTQELMTEQGIN